MRSLNGVVERIREAGAGGEARIIMALRTRFPGLGGTFVTQEGLAAALRIEYNQFPLAGHEMFLRHLVAKKLICDFRRSSLSHHTFAFGSARGEVSLTAGTETLLREP